MFTFLDYYRMKPALLPEGLVAGDAVRVTYNDVTAGTAADPEHVVAMEIVKISA